MSNRDMSRTSEIEERALMYQKSFSYENFRVIRKELFAHLRDPSLSIRTDGISFNTACINKLVDVVYIKIYIDHMAKQLAIKECDPDDKNAIRWCIVKKDGSRKRRKITGRAFSNMVYTLMEWDRTKRYKIIGFMIKVNTENVFLFDLTMTENFDVTKKKTKKTLKEATQVEGTLEENDRRSDEDTKAPLLSNFSEKITSTYGDTVEEDEARQKKDLSSFLEV